MKVCARIGALNYGGDPISVDGAQAYGCAQWEDVTLQVPNTFEVDPVDVSLVGGAVVTTALAFWAIGLGVGSVGRIVRDALRPNIERDD